jgi:predicted ATP-dependent serine protease
MDQSLGDENPQNVPSNGDPIGVLAPVTKASIPLSADVGFFADGVTRFVNANGYLLGGAAGAGKSILQRQVGIDLARSEHRVGYLLTEEDEASLRGRMAIMLADRDAAEVAAIHSRIVVEDRLTNIELLPDFVARQILRPDGRFHGIHVLFVDSVMGLGIPATPGRRWEQIHRGFQLCHHAGITTVGNVHINKSNGIAGPMTLRHNCDCLLLMRQLGNFRLLYTLKNRNGIADQRRPQRLVIDPISLTLQPAPMAQPLAVTARSFLHGPGEIEVQTAISLSLGTRRRVVSAAIGRSEVEQLVDMICQIPGIELNDIDFSISCRIPGARSYWPTLGLALSMTLIGSALQRTVPESFLFVGEVDLRRQVRDIPDTMVTELANAVVAATLRAPIHVICSPGTASLLTANAHVLCIPVRSIDEAVFAVWPQTR